MRQEKQLLLDEIKDQIDQFGSFVIMRYQGLTANTANDFRRRDCQIGGNVEVVRKRILIKAAEAAGVEARSEMLCRDILGWYLQGKILSKQPRLFSSFSQDNEKASR